MDGALFLLLLLATRLVQKHSLPPCSCVSGLGTLSSLSLLRDLRVTSTLPACRGCGDVWELENSWPPETWQPGFSGTCRCVLSEVTDLGWEAASPGRELGSRGEWGVLCGPCPCTAVPQSVRVQETASLLSRREGDDVNLLAPVAFTCHSHLKPPVPRAIREEQHHRAPFCTALSSSPARGRQEKGAEHFLVGDLLRDLPRFLLVGRNSSSVRSRVFYPEINYFCD